jgi:flagellar motor switch protein FliM
VNAEGEPNGFNRKLVGATREQSGFVIERMPGLAAGLDKFITEAQRAIEPFASGILAGGTVEDVRATTLFQAISDCAGLTAAIYANAETDAQLLIALDERIDDLIVASIFGESISPDPHDESEGPSPQPRTAIETALVEEFARVLGGALETGFAPLVPFALSFERLVTLSDAFALGRRDMPAAAARFSLPMSGGACEGLVLFSQSFLAPLRKELEHDQRAETSIHDRRWSNLMETGVKKTRLPVTAVLEEVPMSLGDIANLRIGGILPLQSSNFDAVRLECSGRRMFLCKLGQGEGRYRLEIASPIVQEPDASPASPHPVGPRHHGATPSHGRT